MNFNTSELIEYLDSIRELAESEFGGDFARKKRQLLYEEIKRRLLELEERRKKDIEEKRKWKKLCQNKLH